MVHGFLHHATKTEIDRNYVESHSQSEGGFAFCYLLGSHFKNIGPQKLYKPDYGMTKTNKEGV